MMVQEQKNVSRTTRLVVLFAVTALLVIADQATKAYANEHWNRQPDPIVTEYFGGIFKTTFAENRGAFLSLLEGTSPEVRFWVLVVGNAIAMGGILLYVFIARQMQWGMLMALVLLLGGGIGNLIDRVRLQYVIDFLYLDFGGPVHTGVFNVADMAITAAVPILAWLALRNEHSATAVPIVAKNVPTAAA